MPRSWFRDTCAKGTEASERRSLFAHLHRVYKGLFAFCLRNFLYSSSERTRGPMCLQERMLLSRNLRTHPIAYSCFHIFDFGTLRNATRACLGCHLQSQKSSMSRVQFDTLTLQPVVSSSFYTRRLYVSFPRTQQIPLDDLPSNNFGNTSHRRNLGTSASHRPDR